MVESAPTSDMEMGLAMLFGLLGLGSAFVLYVAATGHNQVLSGWSFAAAMIAGTILITALHIYE